MLADIFAKACFRGRALEPPTKRELLEFSACYVAAVAFAFGLALAFDYLGLARAHESPAKDRSQWAQADPVRKKWFNSQQMNDAAQQRLGVPWKSCCDNGDVFRTRFRVADDHSDQWQYLKDGQWKVIPPDIIKSEDTPDHLPVLFINRRTGDELCFFLPKGGL